MRMLGLRRLRGAISITLVLCLIVLIKLLLSSRILPTVTSPSQQQYQLQQQKSAHNNGPQNEENEEQDNNNSRNDEESLLRLPSLVAVIREFEVFDNDVAETVESVLKVCETCSVLVLSDHSVYPPLMLPKQAQHFILSAGLTRAAPDVMAIVNKYRYVLLLPDGTRLASADQLLDFVRLLESGDTTGVVAGVGGQGITCQQFSLSSAKWELKISATPDSEACDSVHGRAAILMRTSHFATLTLPWARPVSLSLGIQGAVKKWKHHVAKGMLLGEGRELLATEHLRWKYDTAHDERVKALYKALGIKKVVGRGQKVQWYGCSRQTPRCFPTIVNDTPAYLYSGRWTPPCCLEGLRTTARHVFLTLRACRARWWLEGGSLLGAVRAGDIIPWDHDVDIGIYAADIDRCPQLKAARWQTLEDQDGFVWQRAKGYYQVNLSTANHLHVDIFAFTPRDGTMVRAEQWNTAHRQDVDFPEHFLRPFSNILFAGVLASAPNNARDFLEYKFGAGVVENPQYPNPDLLMGLNVSLPAPKIV